MGICWFGIVWLHIPQYQKGGVWRCFWFLPHVLLDVIKYLSNVINNGEYYFAWQGVVNGHSKLFVYLTPMLVIFTIILYSASMPARTLKTMLESTCDMFRSSTYQSIMHFYLWQFLFITYQSYFFPNNQFLLVFWRVLSRRVVMPIYCHI